MVVLKGINFVIDKGHRRVTLQSYNKTIVARLNGQFKYNGAAKGLLNCITQLLSKGVTVRFTYIYREANMWIDDMPKSSFIHDPEPHFF